MKNHTFAVLAYGQAAHLESCLKSLLHQTQLSRIIICTSTPSVKIKNLAKKYHLSLKINARSSRSMAADWNFALSQVKTPYATLAHQDDFYQADYVEKMLTLMQKHPSSSIGFSDYYEERNGRLLKNSLNLLVKRVLLFFAFGKQNQLLGARDKCALLRFGNPICCPSVIYNLKKCSDFKFDSQLAVNLDWQAWSDLALKNGGFFYCPESLLIHRLSSSSATSLSLRNNCRQREDLLMFQQFWPKFIAMVLSGLYRLSYRREKK